jgi:alpha-galactosidase
MCKTSRFIMTIILALMANSCWLPKPRQAQLEGKNIRIEFNELSHSRIVALFDGKEKPLGEFTPSETLTVNGQEVQDFPLSEQKKEKVQDAIGTGQRLAILADGPSLKKKLSVTIYNEFPQMAVYEVEYTNTGKTELTVNGWTNHQFAITAQPGAGDPPFWSYQSGSYEKRPDWVLPLKSGFNQDNFLGMNNSDYGGGTPISDVWRKDIGIGVGHVELAPKLVSLPVVMPRPDQATVAVHYKKDQALKPGESLKTLRTFVALHQGDYFQTLAE